MYLTDEQTLFDFIKCIHGSYFRAVIDRPFINGFIDNQLIFPLNDTSIILYYQQRNNCKVYVCVNDQVHQSVDVYQQRNKLQSVCMCTRSRPSVLIPKLLWLCHVSWWIHIFHVIVLIFTQIIKCFCVCIRH